LKHVLAQSNRDLRRGGRDESSASNIKSYSNRRQIFSTSLGCWGDLNGNDDVFLEVDDAKNL